MEDAQTVELIDILDHAEIRGISDHFEYLTGPNFEPYSQAVTAHGFYLGCEINRGHETEEAAEYPYEYYIFHCRDEAAEYKGAERLLQTGKPVIVSHPMAMQTDLSKLPTGCHVEINNRYVWKFDWKTYYTPHLSRFQFVIGSDAHKPNWLTQDVARMVAHNLGVEETLIFPGRKES